MQEIKYLFNASLIEFTTTYLIIPDKLNRITEMFFCFHCGEDTGSKNFFDEGR